MTEGSSATVPAERTLTTSRVFDAPRELVFKAWTDVKQFARWFPPDGFSAHCELDVRPGGSLRVDMEGEDPALGPDFVGKVFPGTGVYQEVVANERLSFTFDAPGEDGVLQLLMTVLFESQGRKTKVTIHQTADTVAVYNDLVKIGAAEGLRQSLDKLTALLDGHPNTTAEVKDRTLTLSRVFDAPRDLVWTAYTDPKHIVKWMFARDWESPFAETDVRTGGRFRIGMRPADHSEEGFVVDGTYREVVKPERLVQELSDGRLMTVRFEDVGRTKTNLTLSVEMAESEEMERQGYTQILENFARHLATLKGRNS